MPSTILLTGATGFLGTHIARELTLRRYHVRALVRPGTDRKRLLTYVDTPIDFVEGDLTDAARVRLAAKGCAAVIHAAAFTQVNPTRDPQHWAVNKAGTENVIAAVRAENLRRLVYVGTANVFGFGTKAQPGHEKTPYAGDRYGLDYMDSKLAATQLVFDMFDRFDVPAVMVHPSFLIGPFDVKPSSGAMLLAVARRQLPGYPAGGKNVIHVRDAAIGAVNALTMGRLGQSYILGNENLTYRELFNLMAEVAQVRSPWLPLSPTLTRWYAQFAEWNARRNKELPRVNAAMALVSNDGHYFTAQKAIDELKLPQTPIRQAIEQAYAWFTTNGYLNGQRT